METTAITAATPMMIPGLVTVFLFQFVAIWNNFMLPYIMLGDDRLFPITVGLSGLLNQGATQPAMYTAVITGALLSILPLVALFLTLPYGKFAHAVYRVAALAPEGAGEGLGRALPRWWAAGAALTGRVLAERGIQVPALSPEDAVLLHVVAEGTPQDR